MRSLKNILNSSKEEIVKSVGDEYANLNIFNLRFMLVNKLIDLNLLSQETLLQTRTNEFWDALNKEQISVLPEMSGKLLRVLRINNTDIKILESLYDTSLVARNILNNKLFMDQVVQVLLKKIKLLPGASPRYTNPPYLRDKQSSYYTNIPYFKVFRDWYYEVFYTDECFSRHAMSVCYSGPLNAGDIKTAKIILDTMNYVNKFATRWGENAYNDLVGVSISDMSVRDALNIIVANTGTNPRLMTYFISSKELDYLKGKELSDKEIDDIRNFFINDKGFSSEDSLGYALGYPRLFSMLYLVKNYEINDYTLLRNSVNPEEGSMNQDLKPLFNKWFENTVVSLKSNNLYTENIINRIRDSL